MMLQLTERDQQQLADTLRVLLAPLAYSSITEWRRDINRHLKALVDADAALSVLPLPGQDLTFCEEVPTSEYAQRVEPLNARVSVWQRAAELGAFTRPMLWAPHLREYYRSEYYNDYALPTMRSYHAAGIATRLSDSVSVDGASQIILSRLHAQAPEFGERELCLLRLVQPAFATGVNLCRQLAEHREALARVVDSLSEGLLVCDRKGAVVHANTALEALLHEEAERGRLYTAIRRTALALVALNHQKSTLCRGEISHVRTATASYSITGSYLGESAFHGGVAILVCVQRVASAFLSEEQLRRRFDLTRQEAIIARRLAAGESNKAIALALGISPHTARRHTERIFAKLGVRARSEVAARVSGLA